MPVPLPKRAEITTSLHDNEGREIELREWVVDDIYKPLDGYKVWPRGEHVCAEHRDLVGLIKPKRSLCAVLPHKGCDGLKGEKIFFVVIDVTRQEGKTTGGACYVISDLVEGRNCSCLYLAASEGQSGRVFEQKFVALLNSRPDLVMPIGAIEIGMDSIHHRGRNNSFTYAPTSIRSIAAGTFRRIIADETREMDSELLIKLVASIMSVTGVECPHGHMTAGRPTCPVCLEPVDGFECEIHGPIPEVPKCGACGAELDEVFGAALLMSSAGEDSAIHTELVEFLKTNPQPNWHLFSTVERLNKAKSARTVDAAGSVFGELDSTRAIFQREFHNVPGGKGDEFITPKMTEAIADPGLQNFDYFERPSLGFLDCSLTTDLTSLVIVGEMTPKDRPPWSSIATVRIDIFDPKDRGTFPDGRVRYLNNPNQRDAFTIQLHLTELIPRFPGLQELWIDTTLLEDAHALFRWCRAQPWGSIVHEYPPERDRQIVKKMIWDSLEARVLAGPRALRIQKLKRLMDELKTAKTKVTEQGIRKVMDSGKGDRRGKRRMHRDVSMSLAGVCWRANVLMARGLSSTKNIVERMNSILSAHSRFKPIAAGARTEQY